MSAPWSNATAGVWAGKLGGLGSDPREGSEWCHCSSCTRPTTMTGTKLCDQCWERRRILDQPGSELYAAAPRLAEALAVLLADARDREVIGWIPVIFVPGIGGGRQEAGNFIHADQARAALRKAGIGAHRSPYRGRSAEEQRRISRAGAVGRWGDEAKRRAAREEAFRALAPGEYPVAHFAAHAGVSVQTALAFLQDLAQEGRVRLTIGTRGRGKSSRFSKPEPATAEAGRLP